MRRLSYANVVSTLALVVALGAGGAVAGGLVGGEDIKPNAIKGKHVKNGSLDQRDVSLPLPKLEARVRHGPSTPNECGLGPDPSVCDDRQWAIPPFPADCIQDEVAVGGGVALQVGEPGDGAITSVHPLGGGSGWANYSTSLTAAVVCLRLTASP